MTKIKGKRGLGADICDLNGLGAARDICQTQEKSQRNRIGCSSFLCVLATLRSGLVYFITVSGK